MGGYILKKRWIYWWAANIFWIVLFLICTAIVWLREVDGSGVPQTPELKLFSFIVLLIAFLFPLIIQVVWLVVNLRIGND